MKLDKVLLDNDSVAPEVHVLVPLWVIVPPTEGLLVPPQALMLGYEYVTDVTSGLFQESLCVLAS